MKCSIFDDLIRFILSGLPEENTRLDFLNSLYDDRSFHLNTNIEDVRECLNGEGPEIINVRRDDRYLCLLNDRLVSFNEELWDIPITIEKEFDYQTICRLAEAFHPSYSLITEYKSNVGAMSTGILQGVVKMLCESDDIDLEDILGFLNGIGAYSMNPYFIGDLSKKCTINEFCTMAAGDDWSKFYRLLDRYNCSLSAPYICFFGDVDTGEGKLATYITINDIPFSTECSSYEVLLILHQWVRDRKLFKSIEKYVKSQETIVLGGKDGKRKH